MKISGKIMASGLVVLAMVLSTSSKVPLDKPRTKEYCVMEKDQNYGFIRLIRILKNDSDHQKCLEEFDEENKYVKFHDFPIEGWDAYIKDRDGNWEPDGMQVNPPESYMPIISKRYNEDISRRKACSNGKEYDKNVILEDVPLKDWKVSIEYKDALNSSMRVFIPDKARRYLLDRASEILQDKKNKNN